MAPARRDVRRAAFDAFVGECSVSLLRTAYLVTGDAGHAEDLVQDCMFKVARRWARVSSMDSPRAYARRILMNQALDDSKRRYRHRAELAAMSPGEPPAPARGRSVTSGAGATTEDRLELIRALGSLPPRQRAVLVLRYFDDLTESEVASTLGCSIGTVKSTASRALVKMRDLVPNDSGRLEPAHDVLTCAVRKEERR